MLTGHKLPGQWGVSGAFQQLGLGMKPGRPGAPILGAVVGQRSSQVPGFVSARVMNDEGRILGGNGVDAIRQRIEALGHKPRTFRVKKVKQELFLRIDDL